MASSSEVSLFLVSLIFCCSLAYASRPVSQDTVTAVFVIGDSILDGGTNTYIPNSNITANVAPYGETYFHSATGRWTNGRVIPDLLAQALGLPLPPPYLQPKADYSHGANFASGGAGFLDSTNAGQGVVSLSKQLQQFAKLVQSYKKNKGNAAAATFLKNSVLVFAMGSNDIAQGLSDNKPVSNQQLSSIFESAIHSLYDQGVRNFIIMGGPPLGCSPHARYLASTTSTGSLALDDDGCVAIPNLVCRDLNSKLAESTKELSRQLAGASLAFASSYDMVVNAFRQPSVYGFVNSKDACCGGGLYGAADFCADDTRPRTLCWNPSDHVFWDANHPTEAVYSWTFSSFWYNRQHSMSPAGLASFFSRYDVPNPPIAPVCLRC